MLREGLQVAKERSVAEVAVLQRPAVTIRLAVARYRKAGADALATVVVHGAGVVIVAGGEVVDEEATACGVAAVVGAGIVVVAFDGRAHAVALFAVVGEGTDVAVVAVGTREGFVGATQFRVAGVFGAVVAVVARKVIDQAVAVVVKTVALFQRRRCRIAFGQPFRAT